MGRKYIDLTNTYTSEGIYIKKLVTSSGGAGKHKKWICVCPICNEEFVVQSNHLLQDKITSCNNCAKKKFNDLTGQKFGLLTVIKRLFNKSNGIKYLCQCECGNTHIVDGRHLKSGSVQSCGCLKSSLENTVKTLLQQNNILFESQKTFLNCKDKKLLPFDFYIPELNIAIEIQGKQHFIEIDYFGGFNAFLKNIQHDLIKEDFCYNNNIKLLQIAYYEDIIKIINEEIVQPLRK